MHGLVPATEFITWARPEHYKSNTSYDVKLIEKYLRSKRTWMTYRFKYPPVVMLKKLMTVQYSVLAWRQLMTGLLIMTWRILNPLQSEGLFAMLLDSSSSPRRK